MILESRCGGDTGGCWLAPEGLRAGAKRENVLYLIVFTRACKRRVVPIRTGVRTVVY